MATYSRSSHHLEFSSDVKTLLVKQGSTTVDSYALDGQAWVKLEASSDTYTITASQISPAYATSLTLYEDPLPTETLRIATNGGGVIGSIDIRDEKAHQYLFDITVCAVNLQWVDEQEFKIYSPCSGNCSAPNTGCRTLI